MYHRARPGKRGCYIHNLGCYLAIAGGSAIIVATLRCRFAEIAWAIWFAVIVAHFAIFLNVDAIPFSPFVTTAQKVLIFSFAAWAGWLAWKMEGWSIRGAEPDLRGTEPVNQDEAVS